MGRSHIVLVSALLLLAGCGGAPVSTDTASSPTQSPTATTTEQPTATATEAVEPTSGSPTATPTETTAADTGAGDSESEWRVEVLEVVDGDTLKIQYQNGSEDTVRLLGVDTPEVHVENQPEEFEGVPDTEDGRDWLRDWGHKASEFARQALGGKEITIRTDSEADTRGRYGRLLVYAYYDNGQFFNRELLAQGYARMYDSSFSKRSEFAAVEADAQDNNVGVWGYERSTATPSPTPTPTPEGGGDGSGSGELVVETVHYDAEGNDHNNRNDEYVVFKNTGNAPLDLSGWTVTDEGDNHRYTFGSVTVDPGETITLYTGSGEDTESEVYWGESQAVWNNNGDTVHVEDDSGETRISHSYEG